MNKKPYQLQSLCQFKHDCVKDYGCQTKKQCDNCYLDGLKNHLDELLEELLEVRNSLNEYITANE